MDSLTTAAIMSGFIATWVQLIALFYKVGKLEEKIDKNGNNKKKYV